jgi:carbon dioxide concentrating mechanism protein CcmN
MRSTLALPLPTSTTLRSWPSQNGETRYYVSGEVQVEAGAGIAAGVLLRANPGCRIEIGRGVCIGMGSILHACGGSLVVEAGATLGMGVLVIGQGTIGKNACIGSETTLLNCSVLSQAVIPPRSLVGDPTYPSRQEAEVGMASEAEPVSAAAPQEPIEPPEETLPEPTPPSPPDSPLAQVEKQTRRWQEAAEQTQENSRSPKIRKLNGIPGYSELDRLLGKIYPYRQILSSGGGQS